MMPHHDAAAKKRVARPRRRLATRVLATIAVVAWVVTPTTAAHGLDLFVGVGEDEIRGLAYFADGARARGVPARLVVDGAAIAEIATDAEGRFRFDAPPSYPAVVEVATLDGHRAVWEVAAPPAGAGADAGTAEPGPTPAAAEAAAPGTASAPAPAAVPAGELATLVDAAVARHVGPLREQLALAEDRRRMSDVVGGVGYLLGLTGLVALMWRRKGG